MDWLLKHSLIRQYLQKNFKQKEFQRAIKYTLIIGIQTLYQLHGNAATDPYISFTLEQLSSMIVSNNGTLNIQSDLPALNKCLKDIKQQLGDIKNELDTKDTKKSKSQKFVENICKPKAKKSKSKSSKAAKKNKVLKKADSKWRNGDTQKYKAASKAIYPKWWPEDNTPEIEPTNDEMNDSHSESENEKIEANTYTRPQVQHPHIYNQPIAFSIPKQQFMENKDNNIVQLHVNLYPEYMQKCMDSNDITKISTNEECEHRKNEIVNNKKKFSKHVRSSSAKTLTQCTESSQARSNGNKIQSQYLKSVNRNIAPCLKHKKVKNNTNIASNIHRKIKKRKKKKSSNNVPKYLGNVESRIKNELQKDRKRNVCIQNEKEMLMRDIAKYGLNENKNDKYYEEWKHRFGYTRLSNDNINKPSVMSVASAMMTSDLMKAMDPSINKEPTLCNETNVVEIDSENYDVSNAQNVSNTNDSMNMNFLTDLREWAQSLTINENDLY